MQSLTRRSLLLGTLAAPLVARAQQSWPAATTRIVVPYPPAGSTDVIARLVQPELQQRLGEGHADEATDRLGLGDHHGGVRAGFAVIVARRLAPGLAVDVAMRGLVQTR